MTAKTENEIEITATGSASGCCGGGSCGTGAAPAQTAGVTTVYQVSGMTCGHCEGAVSAEVSAIAGVSSVTAEAATGRVTVVSEAPLDEEAVRAAVDEAGYELVGPAA
ncbi:heavy-metal-associated domain-containing protein [Streptomyces clavuligerus]|uniref:Putative regulator n=1 Tax=Streptomyces clavuligerus TaxID=1901 RepID=E2Q4E1_STRCL|nr:heavy-metal-associated domain-containing protein [Streptomyces clavuligerus]ANW20115.1 copper-binding protein [Streptomyces clavuligerus]AXU14741.1 copper chaperone [Streptomyces clavuligerus]EFG06979.1 Putative regulator [Streptomyces clavuligerus]MBY6304768.1 heavy-metal-associated domain-containing protein [Streptomyces clavuligerus]QCS07511.1 copper chaperone [Streptomyces clavuligerus]